MSARILTDMPSPVKRGRKPKHPWEKLKVGEGFALKSRSSGRVLCDAANITYAPKKFDAYMIAGVRFIKRIA